MEKDYNKFYEIREEVIEALDIAYHESMNKDYKKAKKTIKELFPVEEPVRFHNLEYFKNWKEAPEVLKEIVKNLIYELKIVTEGNSLTIHMVSISEKYLNLIPLEYQETFQKKIDFASQDYLEPLINLNQFKYDIINSATIARIKYAIKEVEYRNDLHKNMDLKEIVHNYIFRQICEED